MFLYIQATGEIIDPHGEILGTGYAGHEDGKNNPDAQTEVMVGPLPRGRYKIGPAFSHPKKGPFCMRLTPAPRTEMFGRAGMMIHGDSIKAPGTASNGCIIQGRVTRVQVDTSADKDLLVIRDRESIPT